MNKNFVLIALVLLTTIFLSGCVEKSAEPRTEITTTEEKDVKTEMQRACIDECMRLLQIGTNLDNGPCILDPIPSNVEWVCDVAHSPRQAVDNNPENQCATYRQGTAKHFVEVTPDCSFIRAY
jgi:hypothetical protein